METYIHKPTKVLAQRWYPGVKIDGLIEIPAGMMATTTCGHINPIAFTGTSYGVFDHICGCSRAAFLDVHKIANYVNPGQWVVKRKNGSFTVMDHAEFVEAFEQYEL